MRRRKRSHDDDVSRFGTSSPSLSINSSSANYSSASASPSDGQSMYTILSTLFAHFGRRKRSRHLTMKTFLNLARASNIVRVDRLADLSASAITIDSRPRNGGPVVGGDHDGGMITIKRLTSIVERVQRQYGNGNDLLTFPMTCAVLLRVARCQYLYRAEFLVSMGRTEVLDATAFGALCRERLAPLYLHMLTQGGEDTLRTGEKLVQRITVEGAIYLLDRAKTACQKNHAIQMSDDATRSDGADAASYYDSRLGLGLEEVGLEEVGLEPVMFEQMLGTTSPHGGVDQQVDLHDHDDHDGGGEGTKNDQSWEDVVRQLRSANDIADGLLVGSPGPTPSRSQMSAMSHRSGRSERSGRSGRSSGVADDTMDEIKMTLRAPDAAALQLLEAENQELRRRLLHHSSS